MVALRLAAGLLAAAVAAPRADALVLARGAGCSGKAQQDPTAPAVGSDCGQVHQVIPKFSKASKVGELAGQARAAITHADAAAAVAGKVVDQANEASGSLSSPDILATAIQNAGTAATKATAASGALETSLDSFKGKVSGSEFSGADVEQSDMDGLKKLTLDANAAAELAYADAKLLAEATEKAVATAMKDTAQAAKVASAALKSAEAAMDAAAKTTQKADWTVGDADTLLGSASAVSGKIDSVIADAKEQAPVWQALKDDLDNQITGVTEAKNDVTSAITPLDTAVTSLKEKITPVQDALTSATSGSVDPASVTEQVTALEEAETAAVEASGDLQGKIESLSSRHDRLKATLEEAEKKLG